MEKLEKENAILRYKLREVSSVTNILAEAKDQICSLETRNVDLAKSLSDLQTWAATQDKLMSKSRISMDRQNQSQLDPTTLKNLSVELRRSLAEYFLPVEEGSAQNLREENKQLQERIEVLQNANGVNKENERLRQVINRLDNRNNEKESEVKKLTSEIEKYERILKTPEHAKDIELFRLRKLLEEKKESTKENHIHSALNNETVQLKDRLTTTLNMCQVLATKLDGNVTTRRSRTPRKTQDISPQPSGDHSSLQREGTAPMLSIPDTNDCESLRQELKDVLEKNVRWQIYNNQREEYVHNLLQKYNDINTKLQQSHEVLGKMRSNPDKLSEEQRRYFDNLLVQARQELTVSRNEATRTRTELEVTQKKLEEEIGKIKRELEHWRNRYEEQREVSARLHAECESERRRSNCSTQENKDKKSQINLLQRQVEMYCEDFRAERKEKEDLRREVKHLQRDVQEMKTPKKKMSSFSEFDVDMMQEVKEYSAKKDRNAIHKYAVSPPKQMRRKVSQQHENLQSSSTTHALLDNSRTKPTSSKNLSFGKRPAPAIPKRPMNEEKSFSITGGNYNKQTKESRDKMKPYNSKGSRTCSRDTMDKNGRKSNEVSNRSRKNEISHDNVRPYIAEESEDSELQCPNCGKVYPIDEHLLLLSHIDICGE